MDEQPQNNDQGPQMLTPRNEQVDGLDLDESELNMGACQEPDYVPEYQLGEGPVGERYLRMKFNQDESYDLTTLVGFPRWDLENVVLSPMGREKGFAASSSSATFFSARSTHSNSAYTPASWAEAMKTIREDEPPAPDLSEPLLELHKDYYTNLHQRRIIQTFDNELNWSGKGQHVTFSVGETVPLQHLSHVGSSLTATVDKVLCRRVALARKTMRCNRKWTVSDALQEVYHLQNLRHFHIVQLVGTYLQGRNFSILMYPVADSHLGTFLEETSDLQSQDILLGADRCWFLGTSLSCLASAIAFIHERTTKHMDIKPQNILVRHLAPEEERSLKWTEQNWRIYLADFGLSRSFKAQDQSQTDGPTSCTPRYCAPEVYAYEQRGRSADVFSLGCVFLEILTVMSYGDPADFADARRGDGDDESFHANLERVNEWAKANISVEDILLNHDAFPIVLRMIDRLPGKRPTAAEVRSQLAKNRYLPKSDCCQRSPEPYVAYESPER